MRAALELPTDAIHVRPWPDPVIDAVGLDPRSAYVERFWLGILRPATFLVTRPQQVWSGDKKGRPPRSTCPSGSSRKSQ
jgi:hypothetical protein